MDMVVVILPTENALENCFSCWEWVSTLCRLGFPRIPMFHWFITRFWELQLAIIYLFALGVPLLQTNLIQCVFSPQQNMDGTQRYFISAVLFFSDIKTIRSCACVSKAWGQHVQERKRTIREDALQRWERVSENKCVINFRRYHHSLVSTLIGFCIHLSTIPTIKNKGRTYWFSALLLSL